MGLLLQICAAFTVASRSSLNHRAAQFNHLLLCSVTHELSEHEAWREVDVSVITKLITGKTSEKHLLLTING